MTAEKKDADFVHSWLSARLAAKPESKVRKAILERLGDQGVDEASLAKDLRVLATPPKSKEGK